MRRRRLLLHLGLAGTALLGLSGHTPYRHWQVYRQQHLLVGSSRADATSFELARRIAQTLSRELPESGARASRAPDQLRIASLLASGQWQVAVLSRSDAADLVTGRGMFEAVGAVSLLSLFALGNHLLVSRADFPAHHAWLVAATLTEHVASIPGGSPADPTGDSIPVHPGALAHAAGAPLPAASESPPAGADQGHTH